jgi:peptidyl-prolyl cis-trans isomerase D
MLKTMRKNTQALKPVLWFVVAAFIVSIFFIWGASGKLGREDSATTLVTVGRQRIEADAYSRALRNRIENLKSQYKEINRQFIEQMGLPQQVLEQLVGQALILEKGKELRIKASEAEIRDKIVAMPGLQRDGKFVGYEEYKQALQYNHIKINEFEDSLRQDIVLTKTIQLLTSGLAVTPEEVWENYRKTNDSAKIETLALETSKVTLDAAPSADAIKAYWEAHKDAFKIPEKREGIAVFLKAEDLKKEIELSDSDIEQYYKDNASRFTNPETTQVGRIWMPFTSTDKAKVEAEAGSVLARLRKGEAFAAVAKAYSKDVKAKDGGDYGLYDWKSLPQAEQDEIAKLSAGETSGLITEADGIALIRVAAKTAQSTTSLAEAKPQIRTALLDEKARALAADRIAKIQKDAQSAKSLEAALKKANLKAVSTGSLKSGEAWGENDPSGVVSSALFGLKEKEISAPLYAYAGVGLVELRKIEAPRPAVFDEVKSDVETTLTNERKKAKALAVLRDARAQLTDKNWEDIAAKYKLEVKSVEGHKREQYLAIIGESKEADDLAFGLPVGQTSEPFAFENGYALLRVLDRKESSRADFEKVKSTETAQLLDSKKNEFLQSYLAQLRTEKGVQIKSDRFMQITQDVLERFDSSH